MSVLYRGIGELVTNDPQFGAPISESTSLGIIHDAAVIVEDGIIAWVGADARAPEADVAVEVGGCAVIPGFVDSHAHLVFAGDRSQEFAARMSGESYAAGGIATTMRETRKASSDMLSGNVSRLVDEMRRGGITTFECKSGYGLDVASEARSLEVAGQFTDETTYLGAHVVPPEFKDNRDGYVRLVAHDMLSACAPHAKWIDVFCDRGAFDVDETREILTAGMDAGLHPRLHASQLAAGGGIALGVELGAASIDHCTFATDDDLSLLAASDTVATLLPGAEFSTRATWPDARRFFDAGVTVAISTDCNPGSSYTSSMSFCIAVAVRDMYFTPAQALWAATQGGALALRRNDVGAIRPGLKAHFVILDAPTYIHLAYRPGVPLIKEVVW